jgi:hypothetical protein
MSKLTKFGRAHWWQISLLTAGPVIAITAGVNFLKYTTLMSYDLRNVRRWPSVDPATTPGLCILHSLLFATVLLVLLNTLAYLRDAFNHQRVLVLILYFLSLSLAILWGTEIYFGWTTALIIGRMRDVAFHLHEIVTIILFLLFAIMDGLLYRALKSVPKPITEKQHLEHLAYGLQFLAVDIPVVIGIAVVIFVSHFFLENSLAIGKSLAGASFDVGFRAGALIMHLALSQVVFAAIYLWNFWRLFKIC